MLANRLGFDNFSRRGATCFTNVEHWWDGTGGESLAAPLGRYARVVMFDKRGTNLSDRVADLPGLDQRMDDLRAVTGRRGYRTGGASGLFQSWHDVGAVRRDLSQSRLLNHSLKGVPGDWRIFAVER